MKYEISIVLQFVKFRKLDNFRNYKIIGYFKCFNNFSKVKKK